MMVHTNRQPKHVPQRRGFTLIELLVVCVIIMILIGILLPYLGQARETARLAECAAQQAQLGKSNAEFMSDTYNQFSPLVAFLQTHQDGLTVDPVDENPILLDADEIGTREDARLSYGHNGEYQAFGYGLQMVKSPDERALFYDGLSGQGADPQAAQNTTTASHKTTIIHDPEARGANGGMQTLNVGSTSLSGHIGHGDPFGDAKDGLASMAQFNINEFDARHDLNDGLGNVLFVDGHVESHPFMTVGMFLVSTEDASTGKGNGKGNGN